MFPSPPMQTPAFSPAPSVVMRPIQRGRGFSFIHDRLAQLTIGHRSIDDEISSACSTAQSVDGDNSPIAFSPTGSIPVALGSPALNPRLSEYLSYSPSTPRSATKGLGKVIIATDSLSSRTLPIQHHHTSFHHFFTASHRQSSCLSAWSRLQRYS
jgi:hypothetical protein